MKRSTWDGQTLVYRYGCPHWAELGEEGMRQLRLAHDLRNELVAIEKRYEAMVAAIWLSFPEVATAQAAVDRATAELERLSGEMLAARQRNQSTVPAPEAKAALAGVRKARASAKAELKGVKAELKPAMKLRRAEADAAKRWAQGPENLYRDWAQTRGLGWGTYNDVLDKHRVSVARVIAARKAGEPAEHRFHSWRGEGTLTVQVQRGSDGSRRRQWELADGRLAKEWLGRDRRVHENLTSRRRTLRVQVGRGREFGPLWLELPVVVHRDLPEGADVTYVRVTRRTVAGQPRLSVTLTARLPHPEQVMVGEAVDVDFGWTSGGTDVGVRVARVSTASGNLPPVPADVAELVTSGDWWEVWAPASWRDLLGRDDAIRADRSELLDELRPDVVAALGDPTLSEMLGVTAADVARWRSPARFVRLMRPTGGPRTPDDRLARAWPRDHPLWPQLEAWRLRDRHLWQFEAHERQQTIARRRDAYRKVAAWLADAARVIAIKDVAVADLRRRPGVDTEDTYEARGSRRQVQFAAPAELRTAIENAAQRRGVRVLHYGKADGADGD